MGTVIGIWSAIWCQSDGFEWRRELIFIVMVSLLECIHLLKEQQTAAGAPANQSQRNQQQTSVGRRLPVEKEVVEGKFEEIAWDTDIIGGVVTNTQHPVVVTVKRTYTRYPEVGQ